MNPLTTLRKAVAHADMLSDKNGWLTNDRLREVAASFEVLFLDLHNHFWDPAYRARLA